MSTKEMMRGFSDRAVTELLAKHSHHYVIGILQERGAFAVKLAKRLEEENRVLREQVEVYEGLFPNL